MTGLIDRLTDVWGPFSCPGARCRTDIQRLFRLGLTTGASTSGSACRHLTKTLALLGALLCISPLQAAPVAIVEQVNDAQAVLSVSEFDFLDQGQVIDLPAHTGVVISYFDSCVREEVEAGTQRSHIKVGAQQSQVEGAEVARTTVECASQTLTSDTVSGSKSAVAVFRKAPGASAATATSPSAIRIYGLSPVVATATAGALLEISLADGREVTRLRLEHPVVDLFRQGVVLQAGQLYLFSVADRQARVQVDAFAEQGLMPLASRWVDLSE